ncbi:hypothetical protein [Brucella melitensis]|uniref:hypothetical protein n=1 Tax=Brucella melitensis TaxID=29459 RepID=UPI0002ECACE6|nr:hypothetical protein [Brucella melitensis]MWC26170.1 hypothetical protein [Brucella melitensis]USI14597.1 hypothetical protein NEE11_06490 [Brucella melitensis]
MTEFDPAQISRRIFSGRFWVFFLKSLEDRADALGLLPLCGLQQGNESSHFMLRNYSGFI